MPVQLVEGTFDIETYASGGLFVKTAIVEAVIRFVSPVIII